ncbi:hypothetical protein [Streptomyces sp. IBSBF 2435]|uniref:hypothetical protein n=1 Tax=Streptomyces sp. IBSBF 2435 TaxID=2903531 RepID=UPI002FDBC97A
MKRRIGLFAAVVAAVVVPLGAASAAGASQEFPHLAGAYRSYADCQTAGQAGYALWGPVFQCTAGQDGWVYLYTH